MGHEEAILRAHIAELKEAIRFDLEKALAYPLDAVIGRGAVARLEGRLTTLAERVEQLDRLRRPADYAKQEAA